MTNLDEIRDLLFGQEKQTLARLEERVDTPELRSEDVASVLPNAIRKSHESGGALARQLRPPVDACIKSGLREAPQEYADALYPVMGPAIRRSISETFKAYAQQINQTMEQSLSLKYLRWRFEASRAGVPFAQYVIQKTLQYRVEQGFLIQRDTGLLIAHVQQDASGIKDNDAVSAMFTAIQDFVKDSFSPDQSGRLEVAEMGEFSLWAVHGPQALLVCVIRGVAPKSLRAKLQELLERLHSAYEPQLRYFNGDANTVDDVRYDLTECLGWQATAENEKRKSFWRKPAFWLLIGVLALLAWWTYHAWQRSTQQAQLAASFESVPGIFLDRITREDGVLTVHGLRDPLADLPETIVSEAGLDALQWRSKLRPYRSLDESIVRKRAVATLAPPASVQLEWRDARVALSGYAPERWIDRANLLASSGQFDVEVDLTRVKGMERDAFDRALTAGASSVLRFSEGTILAEPARLESLLSDVTELGAMARSLDTALVVEVTGSVDALGDEASNRRLAAARAQHVADALDNRIGALPVRVSILPALLSDSDDPSERRVIIALKEVDE